MTDATDHNQLRRFLIDLRSLVLLHRELGITDYPASPALRRFLEPPPAPVPGPLPAENQGLPGTKAAGSPSTASSTAAEPEPAAPGLDIIEEQARNCRRCPRHQKRRRVVFGQGSDRARLLLIGQAPGPEEENAGLPCQGEAGALLDRMLAAINLNRQQVYLTTLIKCAPPALAGQNPPTGPGTAESDPTAARECLPCLQQQIAAIKPALICTMGQLPAQTLLRTSKNLLKLRGRFHRYDNIPLMPTLAPDFLLQNPDMKKAAWYDLQMIQQFLLKNAKATGS